jgi:hypothetical protein
MRRTTLIGFLLVLPNRVPLQAAGVNAIPSGGVNSVGYLFYSSLIFNLVDIEIY